MKKTLLRDFGGTASSEAAVQEALKWFSRHQMPNGGWTFKHDMVCNGACGDACQPGFTKSLNAATSMALLPFLGAGQTHIQGDFKEVVFRGLRFLIQNGADPNAKDTFYNATPMTWAQSKKNTEIILLLLGKGATGGDGILLSAVTTKRIDYAKKIIDTGAISPEGLSNLL